MDWNDSDLLIAKNFCKYYGFAYYTCTGVRVVAVITLYSLASHRAVDMTA